MAPGGRPTVVVSFRVDREARSAYEHVLGGVARVVHLADLDAEHRVAALRRADALIVWSPERELGPEETAELGRVRFVQLLSAGADHVRFDLIPTRATLASNVGAYAEPMAEHVLAMSLALARRLPQRHAEMARGVFNQFIPGRTLRGAVCGILGYGGIGRATARLMRAFGARIHAVNRSGRTDEPVEFIGTLADLDDVLRAADVLVIALPLTTRTRGLIGRRELDLMKPDAILVNVARGAVIEEEALFGHLRSHPEFSAGLDVWWSEPRREESFRTRLPFLELPNVLGSPHNSAMVPGVDVAGVRPAAENVRRFLLGEAVIGVLDRTEYEPAGP